MGDKEDQKDKEDKKEKEAQKKKVIKAVTRRTPNVINTPPLLYGLRLVQVVPKMTGIKHAFDIFLGDLTTTSVAKACKAKEIDPLYKNKSGGSRLEPFKGSRANLKAHALVSGKTAPYYNKFFVLPAKTKSQQFVLDLFNTHNTRSKPLQINALLRRLLLLTISRTGTYAVRKKGKFRLSSLKKRSGLFATEQMPLKIHVYLKFQDKAGKTQIADVLALSRAAKQSGASKPPDAKADFDKYKTLGTRRPKSSSENKLELGINRIVALFERTKSAAVVLREVYLDGDPHGD